MQWFIRSNQKTFAVLSRLVIIKFTEKSWAAIEVAYRENNIRLDSARDRLATWGRLEIYAATTLIVNYDPYWILLILFNNVKHAH